jgi:two-component system sensor histidine kinase DesK
VPLASPLTSRAPLTSSIRSTHELFGWIVREGVTNVVRHAHATVCTVRLGPGSVELSDDGIGGAGPGRGSVGGDGTGGASVGRNRGRDEADAEGNGLRGLRERVAQAGGRVQAGPREPTAGGCA